MIYFVTASLRYGSVSAARFRRMFGRDLLRVFEEPIRLLRNRGVLAPHGGRLVLRDGDLGTYLVMSKYFYDESVVARLRRLAGAAGRVPRTPEPVSTRYMLL